MSEINREIGPEEPIGEATEKPVKESVATRSAIGRQTPMAGKSESPGSLHRTAAALRTVVPLAQKLLPLLDGNVASAVANLLAPRLMGPPAVDLAPLETSLVKVRGELALLQDKNAQQSVALKRIDDQLETMKDTLERTALEQREVAEAVGKIRRSVLVLWLIGAGLVVVSIGLNAAMFVYVKGFLH